MSPISFCILLSTISVSPFTEADRALARGEYDTAIREYRRVLETEPKSYEGRFGLARALYYTGKHAEAVEVCSSILEDTPRDPDTHLLRGRALAVQERFEEAEKDLLFVAENYPKYGDAWSALGDVYLWSKRPEQAVQAYTKWIELEPDNPDAYLARAKAYRDNRQFSLTRRDLAAARSKGGDADEIDRISNGLNRIPDALPWEFGMNYSFQSFNEDRADWHETTVYVKRSFSRGSLAVESIRVRRFSSWDEAVALDGYLDLWPDAYINLRGQVTPEADVLSDSEYAVELFQGFGDGWEISGRYDYRNYPDNNLDIYGILLGKYLGDWYLRARASFLPEDDHTLDSYGVTVRRYLTTADDFIEINAGRGKEMVTIGAGPQIETHRTYSFSFRLQKFVTPHWGFTLGANYDDQEELPVGRGVSAGIITRW